MAKVKKNNEWNFYLGIIGRIFGGKIFMMLYLPTQSSNLY